MQLKWKKKLVKQQIRNRSKTTTYNPLKIIGSQISEFLLLCFRLHTMFRVFAFLRTFMLSHIDCWVDIYLVSSRYSLDGFWLTLTRLLTLTSSEDDKLIKIRANLHFNSYFLKIKKKNLTKFVEKLKKIFRSFQNILTNTNMLFE